MTVIKFKDSRILFGEADSEIEDREDERATVTFVPSVGKAMVSGTVSRSKRAFDVHSMFPALSVHPILPDNSPIFSHVMYGNTFELRDLLQTGEASVRIHNEWGRPLLHVSYRGAYTSQSSNNIATVCARS